MAQDIFARIGDIRGESLDAKHQDQIEVSMCRRTSASI